MRIPDGVRRAFRLPTTSERIARELDDEVRFHVEMRARSLIAQGYSTETAYAEALRRFGDVDDLRDYCLSIEVAHMHRVAFRERLATIAQDSRFALRQFRKNPGFALVAAATLALGVGATTSIFSVLYAVALRPLQLPHAERIVQLSGVDAKGQSMRTFADRTYRDMAAGTHVFTALADYRGPLLTTVVANDEPLRVQSVSASRQFFDVLGVRPAMGRFFDSGETVVGGAPVVVVSHAFWQRALNGSRNVIGTRVIVDQVPATIVGVLGPGDEYPETADVFLPSDQDEPNSSYTSYGWTVIGRVRHGVTAAQATADVSSFLRGLHARLGEATWTFDGKATPLLEQITGKIRPLLLTLFAASAVLLLIACANVASLMIARMAVRETEIAVRVAIGAGRGRLVQQLLIEASLLAGIGCVAGVLLSGAALRLLVALRPTLVPRLSEISMDGAVLGFALAVAAFTAIGLGLVAAWRGAGGDLRAALAQSQRTQSSGGGNQRIRGSLVVTQIAMTAVLLIGAGLLARSFIRLVSVDAGFRTKDVVVAEVGFAHRDGVKGVDPLVVQTGDALLDRIRALPGVTAAGLSDSPPFSGGSSNGTFLIMDNPTVAITSDDLRQLFSDRSRTGYADYRIVDGGYFQALGIPLLSGRLMDQRDRDGQPEVAVISATLAWKQWPNQSPIGKALNFGNIDGDLRPITIVGVVGDTREGDLKSEPASTVYLSNQQRSRWDQTRYLTIATTTEAATIASVRQLLRSAVPGAPIRVQPVEEIIASSLATQRFMLVLVGVFAAAALLLATLGVYSVVSYLVAQRGKEISIRVALGARPQDIVRLVIGQGLVFAAGGAIVGAVAAAGTTRVLKKLLYGVSATDPVAFGLVITMLCAVAMVASYLPARRAARTEPMDVLRAG